MTKDKIKIPQVLVRGVEPEVWRRARSQAVLQGMPMGSVLTKLLEAWLKGKITIEKDD